MVPVLWELPAAVSYTEASQKVSERCFDGELAEAADHVLWIWLDLSLSVVGPLVWLAWQIYTHPVRLPPSRGRVCHLVLIFI